MRPSVEEVAWHLEPRGVEVAGVEPRRPPGAEREAIGARRERPGEGAEGDPKHGKAPRREPRA